MLSLLILGLLTVKAADPTATHYTADACQGTYMPYPAVNPPAVPDTLEAVMINHIGRHGARFLSSDKNITYLRGCLNDASKSGALKEKGRKLLALVDRIIAYTNGRWGALDSLGMTEQVGIATRMARTYPNLFEGGKIEAISSYSPRCIMSMYSFAHQLSRMNNNLEVYTNSGRQNSALLRPFDIDVEYRDYRAASPWTDALDRFTEQVMTTGPVDRLFTREYLPQDVSRFILAEFTVVASVGALGWPCQLEDYFTAAEYNALWAIQNLDHYLRYSSSTLTTVTADMAGPLLLDIIETTDAVAEGRSNVKVRLRFGHAETLMPLMALMHLPDGYYMTNYFDTVAMHWRDFYLVPMAANLQLILMKNKKNGRLYARLDLNEKAIPMMPGNNATILPWQQVKEYLTHCLPLIMQP